MWLLVIREPRADAPGWPGRRLLAAVDAIVWPMVWVLIVRHAPASVGLVGPSILAVVALIALGRLRRALWVNHRYWFTTWRWGKVFVAIFVVGGVLKLVMWM